MSKRTRFYAMCLVALFLVGYGCTLSPMVSYQGQLTDAAGNAVTNGDYEMTFRLYNDEDDAIGDAEWIETQTVSVNDGLFNVSLGSVTDIPPEKFSTTLWLGVEVESDGEMTPRQRLTGAPYAMSLVAGSVIQGTINNDATYPSSLNVGNMGSGYGIGVNAVGDAGVAISGELTGSPTAKVGLVIDDVLAGAVITATSGSGVYARTSGTTENDYYGVHGLSTEKDGVFGWGQGIAGTDTGVTGRGENGYGVYALSDHNTYGIYTPDGLYVGGSFVNTGPINYISRNGSDTILLPGTTVSAKSVHMLEGANTPVMNVQQASVDDTVLGVVVGAIETFMVEPGHADNKPGLHFGEVGGKVAPGDYMVIVTEGLAQVSVNDPNIEVGTMLHLDSSGITAQSNGPSIGMAMDAVDDDGMVWVLVGFD